MIEKGHISPRGAKSNRRGRASRDGRGGKEGISNVQQIVNTSQAKRTPKPKVFFMIKSIFWNIRGTKSQGAFERLLQMKITHQIPFIALMEPFCKPKTMRRYKTRLGCGFGYSNCNNKIWIICED